MISTSITSNSITVVVTNANGNKVYSIQRSHPNFESVLDAVRFDDEVAIESLCNVAKSIETFTEGKVSVKNGHVYHGDLLLEGVIVDRVLGFIKDKLPVVPLLRFINKLHQNPSSRAVTELYRFLDHKNLPITPDGNFLAYKGLQSDYFSVTAGNIEIIKGKVVDGKIFNGIGEEIEARRNQVCDNKDIGCSKGLHAGSLEYATTFAKGKVVIVEINPLDVVSIPTDCSYQKLRTCKYKVVGEYELPLNDTYCEEYSSCANDGDDEAAEDDTDRSGYDDEADLQSEDDISVIAYNSGYEDGHDGNDYDAATGTDISQFQPMSDRQLSIWTTNYTEGYDDGEIDRSEESDEFEELYDTGYAAGYRDGFNCKTYGDSAENGCQENKFEAEHYDEGYNKGYDAGVKNRK